MICKNVLLKWGKKLSFTLPNSYRTFVKKVDSSNGRTDSMVRDEILSRVTIVDCERKSKQILLSLIEIGDPVGIDVEVRIQIKIELPLIWLQVA
jgi:hypothetical protein